MRQSNIFISLSALAHNLTKVKQHAPNSKVLAMVKANAYGHGVKAAIQGLLQADAFGVACMQEAMEVHEELTKLKKEEEIGICLIEGAFSKQEWIQAQKINAMCVLHQQTQLDWALAQRFTKKPVWLKVNTGMNRLGFTVAEALIAYQKLYDAGYEVILMMHFANADDQNHPLNSQQITAFNRLVSSIKNTLNVTPKCSVCNSAALVNFPEYHHDWVRPGIMLYGSSPVHEKTAEQLNLKAAMHFTAEIFNIYTIKKGEFVGYGSTWQAEQDTRIGIVSVGYGDGYPRGINQGNVFINGHICPIIGRVSMDMLVVDIGLYDDIHINTPVELWGENLPIDTIANSANTIAYELLCRLTSRPTMQVK